MSTSRVNSCRVVSASLRLAVARIFTGVGISNEAALRASDVLCTADEMGIRSHGVVRLRSYVELLRSGHIDASAVPHVDSDDGAVVRVDGRNGLGLSIGPVACQLALEKAATYGTGWAYVRDSNHFGIAGYYALMGGTDYVCVAMTNSPPIVAPFLGTDRRLGTNPIAMSFPTLGDPVLVDFASSAVSLGDVENALADRADLPSGTLVNPGGLVTTDPADFSAGAALLPLGGEQGHKGYCLAATVDLLCGVLAGASFGPFVGNFRDSGRSGEIPGKAGIGHVFGAFHLAAFGDPTEYKERCTKWANAMHASKPMTPGSPVQVPGEREFSERANAKSYGTVVALDVIADLSQMTKELGLPDIQHMNEG